MNVALSKRGDYVLRAAICLARAWAEGSPFKIREITQKTEIPPSFAPQVLGDLVRAGLVGSRAGRNGGYRLLHDPATISVLDVIEAGEGELHSEICAMGDGPCYWDNVCPLHESWRAALGGFRKRLSESTLAELAERDRALELGLIEPPVDSHRKHKGADV